MGNFTSCIRTRKDSGCRAESHQKRQRALSARSKICKMRNSTSQNSSEGTPNLQQSRYQSVLSVMSADLKFHPLRQLLEKSKDCILREMQEYFVLSGQAFTSEDIFFIVKSGSIEVSSDFQDKEILTKGHTIGEVMPLNNCKYSITALTDTILFGIKGTILREAIKQIQQFQHSDAVLFIDNVPAFKCLSSTQKDHLAQNFAKKEYNDGEFIITEGETEQAFYIIQNGIVSCQREGKEIRKLEHKETFGEQALLESKARTTSIVSIGKTQLLSMSGDDLREILGNDLETFIYYNIAKAALGNVYNLTPTQSESLIQQMKISRISSGEEVDGSDNKMRILLKGTLKSLSNDQEFQVYDVLPNDRCYSLTESHIFESDHEHINETLGGDISEISEQNTAFEALQKVNILRNLPHPKLRDLASALKTEEFTGTIFSEGDTGNTIYLIKEGFANVHKNGNHIRTIGRYDYFGDRSILLNKRRSATVVAKNTVKCWTLTKQDFLSLIDTKTLRNFLQRIQLLDDSVLLKDLEFKQFLGKGSFGKVKLVQHKTKRTEYALKSVSRQMISDRDMIENVILERKILLELDHPMIVKMVKTLKDSKYIYFLTEYIKGMNLFDLLKSYERFSEKTAQFYVSCTLLMLDHLHTLNILYRDLKPENLVVGEDGYPKLIDFGIATKLNHRTYTVRGTPHFMAPEMIKGEGYGLAVDYWSLGVMLYEMIYGELPFGNHYRDSFSIYKCVLKGKLKVGRFKEADELIKILLHRDPEMRGNPKKLMGHDWLRNSDFDGLLHKILKAPVIPKTFNLHDYRDSDNDQFYSFSGLSEPVGWDYQF